MEQVKKQVLYGIFESGYLVYVGITNNFKRRYLEHFNKKIREQQKKKLLYCRMEKYGVENYTMSILEQRDTRVEILQLEIDYIAKYTPIANISSGGGFFENRDQLKNSYLGTKIELKPCYSKDIFTGEIKYYDSRQLASQELGYNTTGFNHYIKNKRLFNGRYIISDSLEELEEAEKYALEHSTKINYFVLDNQTLEVVDNMPKSKIGTLDKARFTAVYFKHLEREKEKLKNRKYYVVVDTDKNEVRPYLKQIEIKNAYKMKGHVRPVLKSKKKKIPYHNAYIFEINYGVKINEFLKSIEKAPLIRG